MKLAACFLVQSDVAELTEGKVCKTNTTSSLFKVLMEARRVSVALDDAVLLIHPQQH